jgi:hypothetical protein
VFFTKEYLDAMDKNTQDIKEIDDLLYRHISSTDDLAEHTKDLAEGVKRLNDIMDIAITKMYALEAQVNTLKAQVQSLLSS